MSPSTPQQPDSSRRAQWRNDLYVVIFEADTRAGQFFDVILLVGIILSVSAIALETVQYFEDRTAWMSAFWALEWGLTLLFTGEYVARLLCVHRPLRYAFSFFGIIDLLACLPMYVTLFTGVKSGSLMIVRSIRLLRVFRILKMMRMLREAEDLKQAVWRSREKIFVFLSVVMVAVTISGTLMYHVEHVVMRAEGELTPKRVDQFTSIPQSMYWAIVTMTTVGYGDIVPRTTIGKVISAALILLGYSLIIVPTGFVSAEVQARRQVQNRDLTSRTCPHCFREGHSIDANFCDMCGNSLVQNQDGDGGDARRSHVTQTSGA
ncbi:ion transporter [Aureliella helgolandensis]|uniref:Cyclic nucleotide-gated potassium channel n=1 Tax=Aureliella helgolandensis TaxID=2527968 RepID=A0A518GHE1_9BACT|nr:ion transporter [Aureliella helgolandensis]QDV28009.1 Cyclic nucleotide-gated potassium channel [Aureliella helgolandensis]